MLSLQRNKLARVLAASTSLISSGFVVGANTEFSATPSTCVCSTTAFALQERLMGDRMSVPDARFDSTNLADDASFVTLSLSKITLTLGRVMAVWGRLGLLGTGGEVQEHEQEGSCLLFEEHGKAIGLT